MFLININTKIQGATFEAQVDGRTFTVKVPMGGVAEGEKISVFPDSGLSGNTGVLVPRSSIPVGGWKVISLVFFSMPLAPIKFSLYIVFQMVLGWFV